jgi:DNA-binding Lrp family transcriptional regulator
VSWEDILRKFLDERDIKIVKILNEDAETSDPKIAKMLNISKSAVRMRRKRLENMGVLKTVGVVILQNLGVPYADVLLKLTKDKVIRENFMRRILTDDAIYEVTEYLGGWNLLIRVFNSDLGTLSKKVLSIIINDIAVEEYEVLVCSRTMKAWGRTILET